MSKLESVGHGVIFRNPLPGHRVINSFYPAVHVLPDGELICVVRVALALYSPDGMFHLFRSRDDGKTWEEQGPIIDRAHDGKQYNYLDAFFTTLRDGTLILRCSRCDQSDGRLMFVENGGLQPLEMFIMRSTDDGRTWTHPQLCDSFHHFDKHQMPAPYSPLVELADGTWMQTYETWKPVGYEGPFDLQMYALFSRDQGKTWGERITIASGSGEDRSFSHGIPIHLEDGRLFISSWGATSQFEKFTGNWAIVSTDNTGRKWNKPYDLHVPGQSSCAVDMGGGRMLETYSHREGTDQPGIKVALSTDMGKTFDTKNSFTAWDAYGREALGVPKTDKYPSGHDAIAYGAPKITRLDRDRAMVQFWCTLGADTHCRWHTVKITG